MICPICKSEHPQIIYSDETIPVFQNKCYSSKSDAVNVVCGDISLAFCKNCGYIWNTKFNSELMKYDDNYQNEQGLSSTFIEHLSDVEVVISKYLKKNAKIIEIGCGKGMFLEMISQHKDEYDVYGYDPAYEGNNPHIFKRYYDEHSAEDTGVTDADLIIMRHVLEHIPNPIQFLKDIGKANKYHGLLYVEVPEFSWICQNKAFYDVFYEHCNYFSLHSLQHIFPKAVSSGLFFGGQYLYIILNLEDFKNYIPQRLLNAATPDIKFNEEIEKWRAVLKSGKKCLIWGAGAKGATFLRKLGVDAANIVAVVDINPKKQGRYIGLTGHQIISPTDMKSFEFSDVIIMNENYKNEIMMSLNEFKNISIHTLGEYSK